MRVSWGPRPSSQSCRLASVSAIMPKRGRGGRRERYWRGRRFCGDGSLAARKRRRTVSRLTARLSSVRSFFRQVGIVKALILAAGQAQDQLLLGNRNRPRHAASAIAVLHPVEGIGPIAAFEALHLALAQLQQAGGFALRSASRPLHSQSLSPVGTLSDSWSPSFEGDRVSLQLWGDIILEHLQQQVLTSMARAG